MIYYKIQKFKSLKKTILLPVIEIWCYDDENSNYEEMIEREFI